MTMGGAFLVVLLQRLSVAAQAASRSYVSSCYKNVRTCAAQSFLFGARRYEKPLTDRGDLENFFRVAHVQTFL